MSRTLRLLVGGFSALAAVFFLVLWVSAPTPEISLLGTMGDSSVTLIGRLFPILFAIMLSYACLKPLFAASLDPVQETLRLNADFADVVRATERVEEQRRDVITHRFTCPKCMGGISYVDGVLPIVCDVVREHVWPFERALWDDLVATGAQPDADRLAWIVQQRNNVAVSVT